MPPLKCSCCGTVRGSPDLEAICEACRADFLVREKASRSLWIRVASRCRSFQILAALVIVGFLAHLVGSYFVIMNYHGSPPAFLTNGFHALQVFLLAAAMWTCLQLDALVRQLPNLPRPIRSRMHAVVVAIEDFAPGASLAVLAILLPWAIGIRSRSLTLLLLYAALSATTMATAATLWTRTMAYERMRISCRAESAQRKSAWDRIRVYRRGATAIGVWAAASCLIAILPLLGVGTPYSNDASGWIELVAWRAVGVSLYLAALIWSAAFVDATEHLRRWIPDEP